MVLLAEGRTFHTHRGGLAHDDLIGAPEGTVAKSSCGTPYAALLGRCWPTSRRPWPAAPSNTVPAPRKDTT